jgi:hypothetical protein
MIFDRAPCLPFSGGRRANALRPRGSKASFHEQIVGIFSLSGESISQLLLRCGPLAVDDHSFMSHASHEQQPRLVNNPDLFAILDTNGSGPGNRSLPGFSELINIG